MIELTQRYILLFILALICYQCKKNKKGTKNIVHVLEKNGNMSNVCSALSQSRSKRFQLGAIL